jgi:hypothetical protein
MRAVSLLLIVTLLAAAVPLSASTAKRACCKSKTSCPMKQHHASGCAVRCGISAPAPRAAATVREVPVMPPAHAPRKPETRTITFEPPRAVAIAFVSPPPTPPPV